MAEEINPERMFTTVVSRGESFVAEQTQWVLESGKFSEGDNISKRTLAVMGQLLLQFGV